MVLESAVDRGLLSLRSAESLLGSQPLRKQGAGLQLFDPRSGSGSETRVRLWLQRRHHQVRCQVSIAHVGRVDLLVGKSLVIEVDSRAHHLADENYAADHRRDLMLHALGFHRLRLTWHQVFDDWPATHELFTATAGGGARLNGEPIHCSTTDDLALALVATGFSYQAERRGLQAQRVAKLLPQVRDLRRFGAAAADLCNLAAGRLDIYFEQWLGPWDLAAGGGGRAGQGPVSYTHLTLPTSDLV